MKTRDKANAFISNKELSNILNISYDGTVKKLNKNKEVLNDFLVVNSKGSIIGIDNDKEQGLNAISKLDSRTITFKKEVFTTKEDNKQLNNILDATNERIKALEDHIQTLKEQNEYYRAKLEDAENELKTYRQRGFISRLLGNK